MVAPEGKNGCPIENNIEIIQIMLDHSLLLSLVLLFFFKSLLSDDCGNTIWDPKC